MLQKSREGGGGGFKVGTAPTTGSTAPQASRNFEVKISPFAPRTSASAAKAGSSMLISIGVSLVEALRYAIRSLDMGIEMRSHNGRGDARKWHAAKVLEADFCDVTLSSRLPTTGCRPTTSYRSSGLYSYFLLGSSGLLSSPVRAAAISTSTVLVPGTVL